MQIKDLTFDIEQSLANLNASPLPPALQGLRHLPLGDYEPRVSIRPRGGGRRIRRDADVSYFDPDYYEMVIEFVASDDLDDGIERRGEHMANAGRNDASNDAADPLDCESAMDQLLDALAKIERAREFVGLKWFRDKYLPMGDLDWARDSRVVGALLRRATEQRLILTSQVPNPNNPLHPVTAIRVNRRHPRFQTESTGRGAAFTPIPIRGGSIADTVLGDRR